MIGWLTGRRRRLQELQSVCELAMSHLEFQVKVHAARLADASTPDVSYLIMLDTADHIQPAALLSLRGYLSSSVCATLGWSLQPEQLVVVAMDFNRAAQVAERTSREDVLASRLRVSSVVPSDWSKISTGKELC